MEMGGIFLQKFCVVSPEQLGSEQSITLSVESWRYNTSMVEFPLKNDHNSSKRMIIIAKARIFLKKLRNCQSFPVIVSVIFSVHGFM